MLDIRSAVGLTLVVLTISIGTGWYAKRFKSHVTEMLGMMIGMTQGMMTGIVIGYFWGAATDMFISNLAGVIIGVVFGVVFGRAGGLMGMMDGGMGGMMGGMMGAMLGVMLQNLYEGWAVTITNFFMIALYIASMVAFVLLVKKNAEANLEIDLVCQMKVDPKTSLQTSYQGKTYYFCAPACKRAFEKNPAIYIQRE